MHYPQAFIEFPAGRYLDCEKPRQISFTAAGLLQTIDIIIAPLVEFVTMPWVKITVEPPPQILTSGGETLTSDGEALEW